MEIKTIKELQKLKTSELEDIALKLKQQSADITDYNLKIEAIINIRLHEKRENNKKLYNPGDYV